MRWASVLGPCLTKIGKDWPADRLSLFVYVQLRKKSVSDKTVIFNALTGIDNYRGWHHFIPGGGTPYVMGDTYVPRFWPPFFTLAGSSTIFLGYFFSSTNTKTIFCGIKTTNSYRIRSFRPQISFFPRSFWVQFSAASGTPPSFFGPSTPPPPPGLYYQLVGEESHTMSTLSMAALT